MKYLQSLMAIFALLAFSCSLPSIGIFYALENEVAISNTDKGISKKIHIKRILKYGSNAIVVSSNLFYATVTGTTIGNYTKIDPPSEYTADTGKVLSAVTDGTNLFAVFIDASVSTNFTGKLFYKTSIGGAWTEINVGDATHKAWGLVSDGTHVVSISAEADKGSSGTFLHQYISGTAAGITYTTNIPTSELKAMAVQGANEYFFFNDGTIRNIPIASINTNALVTTASAPTANLFVSAISYSGSIYAVTYEGYAYKYNGTTWTKSDQFKSGDLVVKYTDLAYNVDAAKLYATTTIGLATIDTSTTNGTISNHSEGNYFSTEIYNKSLWSLGFGGAGEPFFIGSNDVGLWSTVYDSNPDIGVSSYPGLIFAHE